MRVLRSGNVRSSARRAPSASPQSRRDASMSAESTTAWSMRLTCAPVSVSSGATGSASGGDWCSMKKMRAPFVDFGCTMALRHSRRAPVISSTPLPSAGSMHLEPALAQVAHGVVDVGGAERERVEALAALVEEPGSSPAQRPSPPGAPRASSSMYVLSMRKSVLRVPYVGCSPRHDGLRPSSAV